ncbi:class I SAM-dependent methyltransferase [Kriegella aquimaris]|uniref:Guanidinoacetate N-methyltransferase n=1 Tax=Kriegella aquimaris TaxID=192904 RepID=A0A1G9IRA1_9FLAO|nr:class I SAM-dependent methyltransferase [Kriegella aquimaris]SDL27651.1 guanidinoacetate N-methyltransferase [Kriegella aquimaris]
MKKIKRSHEFEVVVEIKDSNFIKPPREAQRNAVVNRAVKEFTADLNALNEQTKRFVPGRSVDFLSEDREQKILQDDQIMEDWLIPVMQVMAKVIAEKGGDILEIGFGRGISAEMLQEFPIDSHTIIECNDAVIAKYFDNWKEKYVERKINLVKGLWQVTIDDLGLFDGIFFHTYPLNEDEYMRYVNGSITFAEHFFAHAQAHLKTGGAFTYFSNEIGSLSREHQRILLQHFSSFSVQIVPLKMPDDVTDTWWADSIAVVKAIK